MTTGCESPRPPPEGASGPHVFAGLGSARFGVDYVGVYDLTPAAKSASPRGDEARVGQ